MNKNLTVSVIMPCYNVEQYIAMAIESVLQQSMDNFELLVVIDGSPDNSQAIAEEFSKKDNRVKVLVKENGGVSSARNFGLKNASGKYIYFIDPDDWIEPDLLEKNIALLESEQSDLVVFGIFNTYDGVVKSKLELKSQTIVNGQSFELLRDELKAFGYSWNKIYKKEIIDKNNLRFNEALPLWEDCVFNFNYLENTNSYTFSSSCYYYYNIYQGSASHKSYPDYTKYIQAYQGAASNYIEKYNPINKFASYTFVYSLFLDVLCSELINRKSSLFERQFNDYFNRVKELKFSGLPFKRVVVYYAVRFRLIFLLTMYRKLKS